MLGKLNEWAFPNCWQPLLALTSYLVSVGGVGTYQILQRTEMDLGPTVSWCCSSHPEFYMSSFGFLSYSLVESEVYNCT